MPAGLLYSDARIKAPIRIPSYIRLFSFKNALALINAKYFGVN